jgi:hypothetical protein
MNTRSRWKGVLAGAIASAMMSPAAVLAEDTDHGPPAPVVRATEPALPPLGKALDDERLSGQRGGQDDAYINDMRSRASITNTSTTNVSTGNNTITDGSFVNAPGMPIVVQNSGNNVVIQNSTILNLQLK